VAGPKPPAASAIRPSAASVRNMVMRDRGSCRRISSEPRF
jgi:hypothetical protein